MMKHCKRLILMILLMTPLSSIVYSQNSPNVSTNLNNVDTCVNKESYKQKIAIALDCFDMYDGAMKKITALNGEIDTLNIEIQFLVEKANIFQTKYAQAQMEIKKHKTSKIWIPIVSGVVMGAVGYGIGTATK